MTNIFLIRATTGSWDDEDNWTVCWFEEMAQAKEYLEAVQKRADKIRAGYWNDAANENKLDSRFTIDPTTGTKYSIVQVEKGDLGKML